MRTLSNLSGIKVLDSASKKGIKGSGQCGVLMSNGSWYRAPDLDSDGATKDDAIQWAEDHHTHWCCDSCAWNN